VVLAAIVVAASLAGSIWLGCSVERHYALLSFFFDGVPDPLMLAASKDDLWRVKMAGGTVYAHKPWEEEQCSECHRSSRGRMLMTVQPTVCLNCHGGVTEQHAFMHGPTAAGACLWCHAPHESTHKSLLRASAVQICRQCHGDTLGSGIVEAHADPTRNCLDCHSGHGGRDRYFLHDSYPGAAARRPRTMPPAANPPP
jgi:predicted CXXCH cytochrome family protein